jgi:hypothetical protein
VKDLYHTDSVEPGDDFWSDLERYSDDAVIEEAVEIARSLLEAAKCDSRRPPALLLGDTIDRLEAHQASRILYHADQMARAVEAGRILDVRRHAMRFASWLRDAEHTAAWSKAVLRYRNIQRAGRCKAGKYKGADSATVRAQYEELIAGGMPKKAAKALVCQEFGISGSTFYNRLQ